jgi:hypothetical protein
MRSLQASGSEYTTEEGATAEEESDEGAYYSNYYGQGTEGGESEGGQYEGGWVRDAHGL